MTQSTRVPLPLTMLEQAAARLVSGGLVAFPTETVYGLGADAENPSAIARIYEVKGRPANHPVIVHVAPEADLAYWAKTVPAEACRLIKAFWPGPLTLILRRADHIPAAVSGGQDSIGLRCPSDPTAQALLRLFARSKASGQGGIAAPSANKFGQVSPTTAQHVRDEFPELDATQLLVLEGAASEVGLESTIVDLSRLEQDVGPVLLRPGHITAADIEAVLGLPLREADAAAPQVSGSLKAHYAPHTPLSLVPAADITRIVGQADPSLGRLAAVVFEIPAHVPAENVDWYLADSDPRQYARNLYALLRRLDQRGYARILLERPPQDEAWQAVNDRIGRAAAAFSSQ